MTGRRPHQAATAASVPPARLADRIYGAVVEHIARQNLAEGDRLPSERELATQFGASRPIIREALSRLSSDGLIETRWGTGAFIRRRPSEHLMLSVPASALGSRLGTYEVRLALEGETARLAAARRTDEDMVVIGQALSDLTTALGSGVATHRSDLALHRAIAQATKNPAFVSAFDSVMDLVTDVMLAGEQVTGSSRPLAERMAAEHVTIVDAIRAQDADGATVAMRYHLFEGRKRLMR